MSVPRVIARCPKCASEVLSNGVCPVCASIERLRATAAATGNMRTRPGPTRGLRNGLRYGPGLTAQLPLSGQDAALPPGDRE